MKRIGIVLVILVLIATGCATETKTADNEVNIGIVQFIEHRALDDVREGFLEQLEKQGITATVDYQNAQGSIDTARTIVQKFKSADFDLVFAIATPAAEAALSITDVPVLFSAVTDPMEAHLVESMEKPGANVTGTSDASDVKGQLSMFSEFETPITNIGIIYSADEANSLSQLEEAKKAAKELNLTLEISAIQTISDLPQVMESLLEKIDGYYILSDNKIASSIALLSEKLIENKIPSIGVEESQIMGGGLMTTGLSYRELGAQTADMAKRIFVDGEKPADMPVETARSTRKIVNGETLKALELDENLPLFKDAQKVGE